MKKIIPFLIALGLLIILGIVFVGGRIKEKYTPSTEHMDLCEYFEIDDDEQAVIVLNGSVIDTLAIYNEDVLYLPYEFIYEYISERFYFDTVESLLLYTIPEGTYMVETKDEGYYFKNKHVDFDKGDILYLKGNKVYVNADYVSFIIGLEIERHNEPNRIIVNTEDRTVSVAKIKNDSAIRYRGGIKSKILVDVAKGDSVYVDEELDDWALVSTKDGISGYIEKKVLDKCEDFQIDVELKQFETVHDYYDGTISMGWHQNGTLSEVLADAKGLNVISPTWFYLRDNYGSIASYASIDYVNTCHRNGIEVWALISNFEEKTVDTAEVLKSETCRQNLINNIISKSLEFKLDGINLDFESLSPSMKDDYIQFVRELSIKCHDNELTLSIDNYVPTDYTSFYNRKEQALYADYVVVMAYDEHYVGSEAGSVSSLPFVEKAVKNTLKEVPANQIILGLPFYTRLWELTPETNDEGDVLSYQTLSKALGMSSAESYVRVNGAEVIWDKDTCQHFAEYEKDGKTYQIWLEDDDSLTEKLKVYEENELAGVSFWKLGFEKSTTYNTIIKYVQ